MKLTIKSKGKTSANSIVATPLFEEEIALKCFLIMVSPKSRKFKKPAEHDGGDGAQRNRNAVGHVVFAES